jgi:hypothetical protein
VTDQLGPVEPDDDDAEWVDARGDERSLADEPGLTILRVDVIATAVFVVVQILAAALGAKPLLVVSVALALTLFVVGIVGYVVGFLQAVGRSRAEEVDLAGLFLLADAPRTIRRVLASAFAVQVVVALGAAAVRPFSALAFGILVPLFGGAAACRWSARYGDFPPRGVARGDVRDRRRGGVGRVPGPPRRRWFDPVGLDDDRDADAGGVRPECEDR